MVHTAYILTDIVKGVCLKQSFFRSFDDRFDISIRDANIENDNFRIEFETSTKGDTLNDNEMFIALDYFTAGWEAAVKSLKDD